MCLVIPTKVISIKGQKAIVNLTGRQQAVSTKLCLAKKGDYVVIQNNMIIQKMSPKQAQKILKLMDSTSSP